MTTNMNGATIAQIPPKRGDGDTGAVSSVSSAQGLDRNQHSMPFSPPPQQLQQQQNHVMNNYVNNNNINPNAQQQQYPMQYYEHQPYYSPPQQQQHQQQYQQQQQFQYQQYPSGYPMNNPPHYGNMQQPQQQQYGYQGTILPSSSSPLPNQRKTTLKLVILGNSGVGKTSLMNQFHSNKFTGQYKATIGADFLSKTIQIDGCTVILTIWDTAGQERFQSLGKAFYRGSDACLLVYDVQDMQSLNSLRKWKEEFESCIGLSDTNMSGNRRGMASYNRPPGFKFIVVGNKADKDDESRMVSEEEGKHFAEDIGATFFECSAKTAMNVNEAFIAAAKEGLEYNRGKNIGLRGSGYSYGQSMNSSGMAGYVPPKKTVNLNRSSSSRMSNDGDCC